MLQIQTRSADSVAALQQAAQILNVQPPDNWNNYAHPSVTTGSTGAAQVGISTVGNVTASWPIPDQFRHDAVQSVRLLVIAASESSYTAQAFVFNTESGASLSSLIIVGNKINSPADPNSPVAIRYVAINTNADIKQQFSQFVRRKCHTCIKCVWTSNCCCTNTIEYASRGNTPGEINIIQQKLAADQFAWFNQQTFNRVLVIDRSTFSDLHRNQVGLVEAIDKYLSNNVVKAEVLAQYNDSLLTALQTNVASLKLSIQKLKLTKISSNHIRMFLATLAKDYGFDDIFSDPQQLQTPKFSYENVFTKPVVGENTNQSIKYIWILGENMNNLTYTINFLHMDINSQVLIETLLPNNTNTSQIVQGSKQLKIARTATLTDDGQFTQERLLTPQTTLTLQTTKVALNILRFISASTLAPQRNRMLSYFQSEIISTSHNRNNNNDITSSNSTDKISTLANAISSIVKVAKEIFSIFKSSSSSTIISRIMQAGFKHFDQKTRILKVLNMPAERVTEFVNAIIMDYNLPSQGSFMLGLTYSDDFAWDYVEYLYSPNQNGIYRSLTLFKNGDSRTNTASFYIVDINANWEIAPDLLIVEKRKSRLGGLFEKTTQSIEYVPHTLTFDEATRLKEFFTLLAIDKMAVTLGIKIPALQLK
ncbi:unnamed protein product [Rotaria magnacalcarata]|uniref:Uncharacterized protein n=5 Tax=Rotaria magnacalcarata TaxID=392030 RepID=A0A816N2G1_9BILA|nr:unnamed protein product [Rotaria magnacalcarata]